MKKLILISLGILTTIILAVILLLPLSFEKEKQQWVFYDNDGEILFSESPHFQPKTQNERLKKYIIAVEDKNFRSHIGVDFSALVRSAFYNLKHHKITSGASTITMQLARLLFLKNETHDWKYKIKQIFYALKLEIQFSKDEILDMYLDRVYFGNNATGIDAAAKLYFGKPIAALSTSQIATLIGIIPRPDTWNPITNKAQAQYRRNTVLQVLLDREFITPQDFIIFKEREIKVQALSRSKFRAPHFVLWAKKKLAPYLKNAEGKIYVHTTLDGKKYKKILTIIRKNISESQLKNISNMSVVALSLPNNQLDIMLGSQDFFDKKLDGEVNMTTATRGTGSTLKPFLYALALEKNITPLSGIRDERQSFITESGSYSPRNFNPTREHGIVRFREALANSYNIAAVDLLKKVGTNEFHNLLTELKLRPQEADNTDLSIILGSSETSLLNLTNAYASFPQHGILGDVQFFTQVNGYNGNKLLEWHDLYKSPKQIFQESTTDWITHALSDEKARWWNFSQGNPLELPFQSAAKTGTSQYFRDNYVIGFSQEKVVGVWAGNADGTPMNTSSGIEGAGEIWHTVMQILHDTIPQNFVYNSAREEISICKSPYKTYPDCSEQYIEFLLPNESNPVVQGNTFSISYPGDGDIFYKNSPILIDVRNVPDGETVRYFIDDQETEKLVPFLPSGVYTISAKTESLVDSIQITIE